MGCRSQCHTFLLASLDELAVQWGTGVGWLPNIKVNEMPEVLGYKEPPPFSSGAPNRQRM